MNIWFCAYSFLVLSSLMKTAFQNFDFQGGGGMVQCKKNNPVFKLLPVI